jgi:hypothetical protein
VNVRPLLPVLAGLARHGGCKNVARLLSIVAVLRIIATMEAIKVARLWTNVALIRINVA